MQLPSNKVGLILIIVVLVVAGIITGNIFSDELRSDDVDTGNPITAITVERRTTDKSSVDQDEDGLFAWQESLYGSDPLNADTDGDGTNDGDEIKEGRDPTVSGPEDKLSTYGALFNQDTDFENYVQGSLTDNLSVELFANYLDLKQSNALSTENQEALVEEIAKKADNSTDIANTYSLNDLNIIDSSDSNLQNYGENFANIYISYAQKLNSIGGEDDLNYIKSVASGYMEFAESMKSLPVPDVAQNVHLEIVNRIHNAGVLIGEFADNYEKDPLKSLFAIQNIRLNAKNDFDLYKSLADYFRDNGIIFVDGNVVKFWNYYE